MIDLVEKVWHAYLCLAGWVNVFLHGILDMLVGFAFFIVAPCYAVQFTIVVPIQAWKKRKYRAECRRREETA